MYGKTNNICSDQGDHDLYLEMLPIVYSVGNCQQVLIRPMEICTHYWVFLDNFLHYTRLFLIAFTVHFHR